MKEIEKRAKDAMKDNNDILILCRESVVTTAAINNMRRVCKSLATATGDSYKKIYNATRAEVETMSEFNITAREHVLCDLEAYESKFFNMLVNSIFTHGNNYNDRDLLFTVVQRYHPGMIRFGNVTVVRVEKDSLLRNSFYGIFEAVLIDDMDKRLNEYKHIHEIDSRIIELNDEVQKRRSGKMKEILIIDSRKVNDDGHVKKTVLKLTEEKNSQEPIICLYYDEDWVMKMYMNAYMINEKYISTVNHQRVEEAMCTMKYANGIINTIGSCESGISVCNSISISLAAFSTVADVVINCIE